MADLNYTKGEWKIKGTNVIRANSMGRVGMGLYTIARAYDPDNSPLQTPIALANARLIAAAVNACQKINPDNPLAVAEALPDMYKALRAFRPVFLTRNDFHQVCFLKEDELWEAVEQALANKAEGKKGK